MKKLLFIAAILFSLNVSAQRERDTIPVIMLVSDTNVSGLVKWVHGFSVREKHNEAEGVIDPYFYNRTWKDYWKHVFYLSAENKPLRKEIIVWQSTPAK